MLCMSSPSLGSGIVPVLYVLDGRGPNLVVTRGIPGDGDAGVLGMGSYLPMSMVRDRSLNSGSDSGMTDSCSMSL